MLTGYAAGLGYQVSQPCQPAEYSQLAAWLCDHHLSYGVGGYWVSSAVTVDSGGCATVRALLPGSMEPMRWMADDAWYDPGSNDARFLVLGPQSSWQPNVIYQHFGRPARAYHTGPYTIMVWDNSLLQAGWVGARNHVGGHAFFGDRVQGLAHFVEAPREPSVFEQVYRLTEEYLSSAGI